MSSSRYGQASRQASRPRPATKAQHDQSASVVYISVEPAPRNSRKPHEKKHSTRVTPPEVQEPPRRPRTQRQHDEFRSMGTWCSEIPERHYSPRITIDESHRPNHFPRAPTPPSPPGARLHPPHPSLLAFDAEFTEPQPGEDDDQLGDAWCLSRKAKTNRQCEQLPSRLMPVLSYSTLLLRIAMPLCMRAGGIRKTFFLPFVPQLLMP